MPLTASKTAAWTMAAGRVVFTAEVPAISVARNSISFQFRTSSAHNGVTMDAATMGTSSAVRNFFMGVSFCDHQSKAVARDACGERRDDRYKGKTCRAILQHRRARRTDTARRIAQQPCARV